MAQAGEFWPSTSAPRSAAWLSVPPSPLSSTLTGAEAGALLLRRSPIPATPWPSRCTSTDGNPTPEPPRPPCLTPVARAGRHRSVQQDAALLRGFVQEHRAVSLVVGLPLDLQGQEGPACQKVRAYTRRLLRSEGGGLGLGSEDVVYWDERFTTRLLTKHTVQVRPPPPATHSPTHLLLLLAPLLALARLAKLSVFCS